MVNNYGQLQGAEACLTVAKGSTKELVLTCIVPTTKAEDAAHALIQARARRSFNPGVVYTDTCPKNETFYRTVFGLSIGFSLGLFHLMQRMVKTLNIHCGGLFYQALAQLKDYVYFFDEKKTKAVEEALYAS